MKIEIINKPMLCWDDIESQAKEWHVLAKVTECDSNYPFKVISNSLTFHPQNKPTKDGWGDCFKNAKPILETIELTVTEISKLLGKEVKIIK